MFRTDVIMNKTNLFIINSLIKLTNSMKKNMYCVMAIAIATVASWSIVKNQTKEEMSDVMLANVEALAGTELSNSNCTASWNKECCVCGKVHNTYAYPKTTVCSHQINCPHYGGSN